MYFLLWKGYFYTCLFDPSTSILHFDFTIVFVRNFGRPDRWRAFFANIQNTPACPNIFADIWEVGRAAGEASFFSFFFAKQIYASGKFLLSSLSPSVSRELLSAWKWSWKLGYGNHKKTHECFVVDGRPPKEIEMFVESHAGSQDFDEVGWRGKGTVRRRIRFLPLFSLFFRLRFYGRLTGGKRRVARRTEKNAFMRLPKSLSSSYYSSTSCRVSRGPLSSHMLSRIRPLGPKCSFGPLFSFLSSVWNRTYFLG